MPFLTIVKADAGAFIVLIYPLEDTENTLVGLFVNAQAVILQREADVLAVARQFGPQSNMGSDARGDELDGVAHEIGNALSQHGPDGKDRGELADQIDDGARGLKHRIALDDFAQELA